MRPHLTARDGDLVLARPAAHLASVIADLELETVLGAMAGRDALLAEVARDVLLAAPCVPASITYRQDVLRDALAQEAVVRELYQITIDTQEGERRRVWGYGMRSPDAVVHRSVAALVVYLGSFRRLRAISAAHAARFSSEGFRRFFETVETELDDPYLRSVEQHVKRLSDERGVLMSARLGSEGRGTDLVLRRRHREGRTWREWIGLEERRSFTYEVGARDDAGMHTLSQMRDTGLASTAVALAESTEHVHRFFEQLRTELAFYIGCLNLHSALTAKGEPFCFPGPPAVGSPTLEARGLYDPALSLRIDGRAIGNDVAGDGKALLVITGANGGGKSTLLRAIGTAQLMMQAGMFVAADAYRADVRDAVLTHFRREEDPTLERGKLDEELARMSEIVDHVSGRSLVLLNESLSATNEREGSQIAREIVRALLERGVKVAYVTHLYDLAETFHRLGMPDALFLRAERGTDGDRPFLLTEAPPLPTSFGRDVYGRVFGVDAPGTPETADAGEAA
jgi:hypothetical protein